MTVFGSAMGEAHELGVLASTEYIQQLREAQATKRNAKDKI
jgi:hypothetical protein